MVAPPGLAFRHDAVQRLRRLSSRRRARQTEGCFVVEGAKLLAEACAAGARVDTVFLDAAAATSTDTDLVARCADRGAWIFEVQAGVLARAGDAVTPQPVAAIVAAVDVALTQLRQDPPDLVVICVDVGDPGNLGAIVRSAGAAGAGAVLCAGASVDLFNPKTVRSSAGALFHLPVVAAGDPLDALDEVAGWGLRRWGTAAGIGCDYAGVDLAGPTALVFGNEAHGLPAVLTARLDATVRIPMAGPTESLNVAAAAAVLCFEAARQRRMSPGSHRPDRLQEP